LVINTALDALSAFVGTLLFVCLVKHFFGHVKKELLHLKSKPLPVLRALDRSLRPTPVTAAIFLKQLMLILTKLKQLI